MASAPQSDDLSRAAVATALRSATASSICLLVVAWLHLGPGGLAVYVAHVVNLQYSQTPFQKSIEHVLGQLAGVLGTTLLVLLFRQSPVLCVATSVVVMFVLYYVLASGRFVYGLTMAAVFAMYTLADSITNPTTSWLNTLVPTVIQLFLGVFAAEVVNFLTRAETALTIQPGGEPLLPVRGAWINRLCLTLISFMAIFVAFYFDLPLESTAIAAVVLSIAPDPQALGFKGLLRIAAVLVGSAYAYVCLLLLTYIPSFFLLLALLFLGMFLGTYVGQRDARFSYLGLQLGIVLAQVLVVPADELVNMNKAISRLIGALVGVAIALAIHELWPSIGQDK